MKLRVSETSITEELLYRFYMAFSDRSIPIRLFESINEHKNGSDIEVLVETDSGFLLLTCQAKITYKSGKYKSFYHQVGGARQIDLLRAYADKHGGIAQYLLFNFIPDWRMSKGVAALEKYADHGITHISADKIYEWMDEIKKEGEKSMVPGFNEFHPKLAKPFHELLCKLFREGTADSRDLAIDRLNGLKYYSEDEVASTNSWRKITTLATIGYLEAEVTMNSLDYNGDIAPSQKQQKPTPEFNPKFRIVIGKNPNNGGIYPLE